MRICRVRVRGVQVLSWMAGSTLGNGDAWQPVEKGPNGVLLAATFVENFAARNCVKTTFSTDCWVLVRLTWIGGNVDWVDGGAATNWNPNDEQDSNDEANL